MTFDAAIAFVLESEGLVSNDSQDPGGLTKFGISSRLYPEVASSPFSRTSALAIYRRDYWDHCRCGELPSGLDLLILDTAANCGPPTAVRWLQQALGLPADGRVGPLTLRAAAAASPDVWLSVLTTRALSYAGDAAFLHFGRGWFARLFRLHHEILTRSASALARSN